MLDGLRLSLTTLTVARVTGPRVLDRRIAGQAMEFAPLVGLLLGLAAAAVLSFFQVVGDGAGLLPAALAIATLALLTRGLHLDGLADLTDGLASYRDPAGARAVMKAPDVGPLGVAAVVLMLLVQVAALATCLQHGRGAASLVLSIAVGRLAITASCRATPAATAAGLGALVAQTVRPAVPALWGLLLTSLFASYAVLDADVVGSDQLRVVRTVLAVVLALLVARVLRAHAVRRIGGLTGDVLGALSEVATTVCLVVLASSA